jgi:hypothetical protein
MTDIERWAFTEASIRATEIERAKQGWISSAFVTAQRRMRYRAVGLTRPEAKRWVQWALANRAEMAA